MHIKSLEIAGFKSYKHKAGIDSFSSGQNTIVGRNGSGKSNVFRAIQFVLGEKAFSNLNASEKKEVLHEGDIHLPAHVQIAFDNSERRFPLESDEVTLRRTLGAKKDEWFLNGKHSSKAEVISLLESAGFSRSNPYYIVQQGKVNALCLMKDEQRLELLKEVAGTTVYEERRRSSEGILEDTTQKRDKIQGVVAYIEERLDELKDEKEELEAFRALDRRKRALQYTLYDLEMQSATRALDSIASEHAEEAARTEAASEARSELNEKIERLETEASALAKHERRSDAERKLLEEDSARLVKARATAELRHRDMEEREQNLKEQARLGASELESLEKRLTEATAELEERRAFVLKLSETWQTGKHRVRNLERRRVDLENKQGRKSQFSNQAERDAWLSVQIKNVAGAISEKDTSRAQLNKAVSDEAQGVEEARSELEGLETRMEENGAQAAASVKAQALLRRQRDEAADERKRLWRERQKSDREQDDARSAVKRATKALSKAMPHSTASGLDALGPIAEELGLVKGVHVFGPLYELLRAKNETYSTAIEVAAGNQLTHVVVNNDETAARLMKELQRRKCGRVTFKPLAQIAAFRTLQLQQQQRSGRNGGGDLNDNSVDHDIVGFHREESEAKNASSSQQQGQQVKEMDAVPLIRFVEYPPAVAGAVRMVLGKVLLCADAEVASKKRRQYKVNCVTLNGEEVNRRGALTGGFYDKRKSKLRLAAAVRDANENLAALESDSGEAAQAAAQADQAVTAAINELTKAEASASHEQSVRKELVAEVAAKKQDIKQLDNAFAATKASLDECNRGLEELMEKKQGYETELATPMLDALTPEEQTEIAQLKQELIELKREQGSRAQELTGAKTKVKDLEVEIEQNLNMRKNELLVAMGRAKGPAEATRGGSRKRRQSKTSKQAKSSKKGKRISVLDDDDGDDDEDDEDQDGGEEMFQDEGKLKVQWVAEKRAEYADELQAANKRVDESKALLAAIAKESDRTREAASEARAGLAEARKSEENLVEELTVSEERLDKLQTKRSVQVEKREVSARKIRELGSLSTEELDKVNSGARSSTKALMSEIKKTNARLQKYSHVNKKALDQFISFSDRREALLDRKDELDHAEKSIVDLIKHLDHQKEQDILRTFRQVSKNFRDVFKELVPNGKGELVMVTGKKKKKVGGTQQQHGSGDNAQDAAASSAESGVPEDDDPHVEEFIGISPRVSFTGKAGEQQLLMKQLSGGQRALVALTLIFAIQRCDPAPFYLFDEIDSALDTSYRTTVAAMIKRQSKNAQFITTTFRPELVKVSDKCFGVQFQNKISSLAPIDKADANKFVETSDSGGGSTARPDTKKRAKVQQRGGQQDEDAESVAGSEPPAKQRRSNTSSKRVLA